MHARTSGPAILPISLAPLGFQMVYVIRQGQRAVLVDTGNPGHGAAIVGFPARSTSASTAGRRHAEGRAAAEQSGSYGLPGRPVCGPTAGTVRSPPD